MRLLRKWEVVKIRYYYRKSYSFGTLINTEWKSREFSLHSVTYMFTLWTVDTSNTISDPVSDNYYTEHLEKYYFAKLDQ